MDEVPVHPDSIVDFVPVDYVTDGLMCLLDAPAVHGTYHLVAGEQALTVGELADAQAAILGRAPARLLSEQAPLPQGAEQFVPYFDVHCRFGDRRARSLMAAAGIAKVPPEDYLGRLIEYAQRTRWGKRPLSRQSAFASWSP